MIKNEHKHKGHNKFSILRNYFLVIFLITFLLIFSLKKKPFYVTKTRTFQITA